ncbi:MAG TPA: hypothetical protein VHZ07_11510 [Bryobacteraceae bacterium]|nr:hypothetical protein [Bryobacteraceae bacterium]
MRIHSGLMLSTLVLTAQAAELKQETVVAWQEYVRSATAKMQDHLHGNADFIKADEDQDYARRVRSGEILVSPAYRQGVTKVPNGLIHDWTGGAFIPNATLKEALSVVRDYDRYSEFYRPTVVDSKSLAKDGHGDRFSMVLMNKAMFMKTALDSDYRCDFVRVDERRWYSISETTRVQEIADFGSADQHFLDENEGSGYIWRLFSITRFEERDGGVYVELEAIALSRDIPGSLRWIVEPIVRRISRNSLAISLRQTEQAVRAGVLAAGCKTQGQPCSTGRYSASASTGFGALGLLH